MKKAQNITNFPSEKWVSVNDAFPIAETQVVVCTVGGQKAILECSPENTRSEFEEGWHMVWYLPTKGNKRTGHAHHLNKITHWMYIPALPISIIG